MRAWLSMLALVSSLLGGCATATQGTSQTLSIDSDPQGAACALTRDGQPMRTVTTPASVTVDKSRKDISLLCRKPGFEDTGGTIRSDLAAMTFGNVLVGGAIGLVVDAASGAGTKYDKTTFVALTPKAAGAPETAPLAGAAPGTATPVATLPGGSARPAPAPSLAPTGLFAAAIGSEHRDAVDLGNAVLPLLDGPWILAGKGSGVRTEQAASLIRLENGRLAGIIRVWAGTRPSAGGYALFRQCGRSDVLAATVTSNLDYGEQDCWLVNHYDMREARATSTQPHALEAYGFLDSRGIAVPDTMLVGIHRVATRSGFVTVWYQVNPELAGFPPPATSSWRESAWHRDRIAADPQRAAYVEAFRQAHAAYQDQLRRGLRRDLAHAE